MNPQTKFPNVMIVDDSPLDRFIAERLLSVTDFAEKVTSFPSGVDALARLLATDLEMPQLMFLDINMPVVNGFDVLDSIHEAGHKNLVVVMLSSSIVPAEQEKVKLYPQVHSFMSKPLDRKKIQDLQASFA